MSNLELRTAVPEDALHINEIYNWYVANTAITFDLAPRDRAKREQWIEQFADDTNPYHIVVGLVNGKLIGFAYNAQFRPKAAYRTSTEVTIYLDRAAVGNGFGKQLYSELFSQLSATNLHRAYAIITTPNPASLGLHKYFGFKQLSTLSEVGQKFGQFHDVTWLEKKL